MVKPNKYENMCMQRMLSKKCGAMLNTMFLKSFVSIRYVTQSRKKWT